MSHNQDPVLKKPLRSNSIKLLNIIVLTVLYIGVGFVASSLAYTPSSHLTIAHRVMGQAQTTILNTFDLEPSDLGEGMMDYINSISSSFKMRQICSRDEAREIVVRCEEILLNEINNDEEIRPFLVVYPFTTNEACVMIHFCDRHDLAVTDPFPYTVRASDGKVVYCYMHSPDQLGYSNKIFETYEEALAIVKGEKPDTPPDIT